MPALDIGLLRNLEEDEKLSYEYQDSYPNYPEYQHNSAEQPEYGHVVPNPHTSQCPDTFIQCTDGLSGFSNHDSSSLAGESPTLQHLRYREQIKSADNTSLSQRFFPPIDEHANAIPFSNGNHLLPSSPLGEQLHKSSTFILDTRATRTSQIDTPYAMPATSNAMKQMSIHNIPLVSTRELPDAYRRVFNFNTFNAVQSKVFQSAYITDDNLVVSSPTGSGKTVIFELAILRMHSQACSEIANSRRLAVYLAPTKALCAERYRDWTEKFHILGLKCLEYTGDTAEGKGFHAESKNADIVITTPEKWDSITRRPNQSEKILKRLGLMMIDEVHILHDPRGAVLEVVVSRMRTISQDRPVRVVALSATVPNVEDVARWLRPTTASASAFYEAGGSIPAENVAANAFLQLPMAKVFKFGEDFRPSRLERYVKGFPRGTNDFAFTARIEGEVYTILQEYAKNKPVLIFSPTRKSSQKLGDTICKQYEEDVKIGRRLPWRRRRESLKLNDKNASKLADSGIAIHHGGLDPNQRRKIEDGFRDGSIMIIVSTSTLAVGVNLPAHTVIVAGTKHWNGQTMIEYADLEMQQMAGRAGRPQFDRNGQVVIMCDQSQKDKWRDTIESRTLLESNLHDSLTEHINSEISLKTIRNMSDGRRWIQSSFLYVRIQQNPRHYASALGQDKTISLDWQQALDDFLKVAVGKLQSHGLVEEARHGLDDDDGEDLRSTSLGDVMSACVLKLETMVTILSMTWHAGLEDLLRILSSAAEYSDLTPRQSEKALLRKVNKGTEIRFPLPTDKVASPSDKVFLLIQICLGAIMVDGYEKEKRPDFNVTLELFQVWKTANRICRAIVAVACERKDGDSLFHSLEMLRSINAWEDSAVVLRQIDSIGPKSIKILESQNIRSFKKLCTQQPQQLEMLLNRQVGYGRTLIGQAGKFPSFSVDIQQLNVITYEEIAPVKIEFGVTIRVEGELLTKSGKKGTRASDRSISMLALLSTGDYVTYRRIGAKFFDETQRYICMEAEFTEVDQKLIVMVGVDQIAGCRTVEEYVPSVPIGVLAESSVNDDMVINERPGIGLQSVEDEEQLNIMLAGQMPAVSLPDKLPNGNWKCRHTCKNRCKHSCCQEGVKNKPTTKFRSSDEQSVSCHSLNDQMMQGSEVLGTASHVMDIVSPEGDTVHPRVALSIKEPQEPVLRSVGVIGRLGNRRRGSTASAYEIEECTERPAKRFKAGDQVAQIYNVQSGDLEAAGLIDWSDQVLSPEPEFEQRSIELTDENATSLAEDLLFNDEPTKRNDAPLFYSSPPKQKDTYLTTSATTESSKGSISVEPVLPNVPPASNPQQVDTDEEEFCNFNDYLRDENENDTCSSPVRNEQITSNKVEAYGSPNEDRGHVPQKGAVSSPSMSVLELSAGLEDGRSEAHTADISTRDSLAQHDQRRKREYDPLTIDFSQAKSEGDLVKDELEDFDEWITSGNIEIVD